MRAGFWGTVAVAAFLTGCSAPSEQPETKAPQWGRGSNANVAPVVGPPVPNVPTVAIDTVADGIPYGAAAAGQAQTGQTPTDQTTPAQRAGQDKAAAAAGLPPTPQTRTSFACDNGETVEVRFFPDQGIAVLVRAGQNTELQAEPVASGFKYTNGQTTVAGKGNAIMLNMGMMATAKCAAKLA